MVADGLLAAEQADQIGRRYGIPGPASRAGSAAGAPSAAELAQHAPTPAQPPRPRRTAPALAPFLSEHGVAIVLYLGAFLVVSAVLIYLGYNWGEVGGLAKLAALVGLTLGFFAAAAICLPRPSVRQAGRTFLALGALLVPASIAGTYTFLLADGPLPQSAFWLLGASLSGLLYAGLSVRLESRAYGALATLAAPVAAASLTSLTGLTDRWWPPAAELALAAILVAAGSAGSRPLAVAARTTATVLLPIGAPFLARDVDPTSPERWAMTIALLVANAALAREAPRLGALWAAGPVASLLVLIATLAEGTARLHAPSLLLIGCLQVWAARRLPARPSIAWDVAGGTLAWLAPLLAWDDVAVSLGLFAAAVALFAALSGARHSPAPLYPAILAADLAALRILGLFGEPSSPSWRLGVALWPLTLLWWGATIATPRGWSHPFWAGALLTGLVAVALTLEQHGIGALMAASFASASVVAARRQAAPVGLVATVCWLSLALYQAATWADVDGPHRLVILGLGGWLLWPGLAKLDRPVLTMAAELPPPNPRVSPLVRASSVSWPIAIRTAAVATAAIAAALLTSAPQVTQPDVSPTADRWLVATALAWANLALLFGAMAAVSRSALLALAAALAFAPAMASAIARLHPTDAQAYALPIGLYLLGVAHAARRYGRSERNQFASALAALGAAVLLVPGILQVMADGRAGHALWTGAEGLALAGWGIATRWRPLAVAGVAAVVAVTLRQVVDAVYAIPTWALLGGTGLVLLAAAVGLLLLRDRLRAAGRLVSERWSTWD